MIRKAVIAALLVPIALLAAPLAASAVGYVPEGNITVSGSTEPGGTATVTFSDGSFTSGESVRRLRNRRSDAHPRHPQDRHGHHHQVGLGRRRRLVLGRPADGRHRNLHRDRGRPDVGQRRHRLHHRDPRGRAADCRTPGRACRCSQSGSGRGSSLLGAGLVSVHRRAASQAAALVASPPAQPATDHAVHRGQPR